MKVIVLDCGNTFKATMRDGKELYYKWFSCINSSSKQTVIFVHGITSERTYIHRFAEKLQQHVNVCVPVLRGYRSSGDINHVGQYDDDLEDLYTHVSNEFKSQVIWAGHSMG